MNPINFLVNGKFYANILDFQRQPAFQPDFYSLSDLLTRLEIDRFFNFLHQNTFGDVMRGQLSAEMLILITVVLAIVAIAATQLMKSAKSAGEQVENQSQQLYERTSSAMKARSGEFCINNEDCQSGSCQNNKCT